VMVKAIKITDLECAADAFEGAFEVLRVRYAEFAGRRGDALDFSDIEGVHEMRVAARRLRSALRDFMPLTGKRRLKKTRRDLREISDALGAVRDRDVAVTALEALSLKATDELIKKGVSDLLEERKKLREADRLDLTGVLTVARLDRLEKRFFAALDKAASRRKSGRNVSFNECGRRAVAAGLKELLELGEHIHQPCKREKLHQLRISAKHLRYTIELFAACWGESIAPIAEEIAAMQSALGGVHDCDIWIDDLADRLRRMRDPEMKNESDYQSASWLLSKFVKKRTRQYRAALEIWRQWQADGFAERVRTVISARGD
jgi:CHAD domain-containing protein